MENRDSQNPYKLTEIVTKIVMTAEQRNTGLGKNLKGVADKKNLSFSSPFLESTPSGLCLALYIKLSLS